MDKSEALAGILREQKKILTELTVLTRTETEAIVSHDLNSLKACLREKESLKSALSSLGEKLQANSGGKTLSETISAAPEPLKEELTALRGDLKETVRELQSISETNTLLLKHGLAYIRQMREKTDPTAIGSPYTRKGQVLNSSWSSPVMSSLA
jgi:flagellar biosynthesis/type III secretory pathway chaperone